MKKLFVLFVVVVCTGMGCAGVDPEVEEAAQQATKDYCFEIFGVFDTRYDDCYEKNYSVFKERIITE